MSVVRPRVILVPYDFSDLAAQSFPVAAGYGSDGANIHIIHVLPQMSAGEPGVAWGEVDDAERIAYARRSVREALQPAGLAGAKVHIIAGGPGNPAQHIAELARRIDAELVITTSHGRTGLMRLALGSVAERIVRLAPCAVLVLRADS